MTFTKIWKRRISWTLVLALVTVPVLQASAEELPPETEVTEAAETTEITEATEATEAIETTEATEAIETTEATEVTEETEADEVTEATEETKATEVTEVLVSQEAPILLSLPQPTPIGEVLRREPGTELLLIQGVVVMVDHWQAVLQDETGGIRMSFSEIPEISLGDILLVSGRRSGGFAVETFEKTGTGTLPALETTLAEGPSGVRLLVKGAVLGRNTLAQRGFTCPLKAMVPGELDAGDLVDVWGVLLDGTFHADTITAAENQAPEIDIQNDWNFYFGQLHAHTNLSDGLGSPEEAFAYARQVENLDFFAVTDHSNSFDNGEHGVVDEDGTSISQDWATGKAAANAATDETFVGIFGYEMTWQEDLAIGHINTFGTPGWQTREQPGMGTLDGYLEALEAVPDAVSQFNHPGPAYGDFYNFSKHTPRQDARVHLLEVGSEGSFTAYDAYTGALDAGWHLAPSNNQNNHKGNWGSESQERTVVLAKELTEEAIYDAIRHYRVYATEDADLKIHYQLNDQIMGSILPQTKVLQADILLEDGSGDPIGRVEVITDDGKVAACQDVPESRASWSLELPEGGSYYYLRISRGGKITAVTAPVWLDTYEDLGITDLCSDAEKPIQGTAANLSLTLYNHENLPFVVEKVVFSTGTQEIQQLFDPGSVAPVGELTIPLAYTQQTPGAVTITATVTGTIAGLPRSYQKSITLRYQAPRAEQQPIEKVRSGMLGEAYRIRGYVTAGTANPHNTFPDSIYLQDETGGMEIVDFADEGIQLGTPMEVQGILRSVGGNLVLAMTDYELPEEDFYRHVPRTMAHEGAMNYEANGGQLLQIQGHVVSVTKTADNLGVSRFTLRDIVGDLATVIVEEDIGSGAYGTNELVSEVRQSSTVRAMGLLHVDEFGTPVLRVRNCDEVVYVPPVYDPSNPKTGDWLAKLLHGS